MSLPFTTIIARYLSSSFFDTASVPRLPVTDILAKIIIGAASVVAAVIELFHYFTTHKISDLTSVNL